jgi:hypothetical protein
MKTSTLPRRAHLFRAAFIVGVSMAAACSDSPTDPASSKDPGGDPGQPPPGAPATGITRGDLHATGTVHETSDGYTVDGELSMATGDSGTVVFHNAAVRVSFDASGHVTGLTGTVEIPSPSKRITFADPVRAQVGLFNGRYLNEHGDLGILVEDDTDYFVYDVSVALQMNVATGDTGEGATEPVVVRAPVGGRILMVVDYEDPMYYTFGSQDLLGSAGVGWSLHHRIPFQPANPVSDLGSFEGGSTRVGSMSFFKILSVDGQLVDNEYSELHLVQKDPLASSLRAGYQAGFNGDVGLDLFVKDIAGIEVPLAGASGGVWSDVSTDQGFQGHVYARGRTTQDYSWWPSFIPARPVTELDVDAFVKSDGTFEVGAEGEYGWDFPDGVQSMAGKFVFRPDSLALEGTFQDGDVTLSVGGRVTRDATTLLVQPPQQLLDAISNQVNDEVLPRISDAQKAWENLEAATADYDFELSLRGLRSSLPDMVDVARKAISDAIASAVASQKGKVWYGDFRDQMNAAAKPYYQQLDALKAAAQDIHDNQTTRDAIAAALRGAAAKKIFTTTYKYTVPVLGTLYSRTITVRVLTDAQAAQLIGAADNVKYIQETSDRRIGMQQIYDQVDDKALFEQVRDDVQDGVIKIRGIDELGVVCRGTGDQASFDLYASIDGRRHDAGTVSALTVAALLERLPGIMIDALTED